MTVQRVVQPVPVAPPSKIAPCSARMRIGPSGCSCPSVCAAVDPRRHPQGPPRISPGLDRVQRGLDHGRVVGAPLPSAELADVARAAERTASAGDCRLQRFDLGLGEPQLARSSLLTALTVSSGRAGLIELTILVHPSSAVGPAGPVRPGLCGSANGRADHADRLAGIEREPDLAVVLVDGRARQHAGDGAPAGRPGHIRRVAR